MNREQGEPLMIPFIDLKAQFKHLEENIRSRIDKVFEHGKFIMGPEVQELEAFPAEIEARQGIAAKYSELFTPYTLLLTPYTVRICRTRI